MSIRVNLPIFGAPDHTGSPQENQPHKPYAFQGSVIIGEHLDISEMAIRSAPIGAGDVGERKRRRIMLKGIQLKSLLSVQPAPWLKMIEHATKNDL